METVDLTNITELISYLNDLLDKGKSKAQAGNIFLIKGIGPKDFRLIYRILE